MKQLLCLLLLFPGILLGEENNIYPNKLNNRNFSDEEHPRFDFEKTTSTVEIGGVFSESNLGYSSKKKTDSSVCLSIEERISLSLMLHDVHQARILLEELQKTNPEEKKTRELFFEYFIELKDFEGIQTLYNKLSLEKKEELPFSLTEKIAWVVIEQALESAHPKIRTEAALAAAGTHDSRGAHVLEYLLTDPHQDVRALAFQLAIPYKDACIQERAAELATIPNSTTQLMAARLLAEQKASQAKEVLLALMKDESLCEPYLFEIARLLATLKESDKKWVKLSLKDSSPMIRTLAAAVLLQDPIPEEINLLPPLLHDPSFQVRQMAATSLGLYQGMLSAQEETLFLFSHLLNDPSFSLQSTAAWALLLSTSPSHKKLGENWFQKNIKSSSKEEGLIATSRLIRAGKEGILLAQKILPEVINPYVRLNLSIFLLIHRAKTPEALFFIQQACVSKELFGQESDGFFSWVGPSSAHDPFIPRLPEAEDLLFRLYLFALQHYAGEAICQKDLEKILHERFLGLSAATAQFLFQEFLPLDEVLTPLLSHQEEIVRIQAALLLAIFSRSKKAAEILLTEYRYASKEGKEILLLGFGALPLSQTKSFLFPLLFDPSQALRTRAAGVFLSSSYQ